MYETTSSMRRLTAIAIAVVFLTSAGCEEPYKKYESSRPGPSCHLVHLEPGEDLAHFRTCLKDASHPGRLRAIEAIGDMGAEAKEALPELRQALRDQDYLNRAAAAESIGQMGPDAEEAVADLRKALNDEDLGVRIGAMRALASIGRGAKEAIPELCQAIGDKDPRVRDDAKIAINAVHDASFLWSRRWALLATFAIGITILTLEGRFLGTSRWLTYGSPILACVQCVIAWPLPVVPSDRIWLTLLFFAPSAMWFIVSYTPADLSDVSVAKECSNCHNSVSPSARAGGRCPHCSVYWASDESGRALKEYAIALALSLAFLTYIGAALFCIYCW